MSERLESINFKRIGLIVGIVLLLVVAVVGLRIYDFFLTDEPKLHADVIEHFKYGSIGSEAAGGVPYWLFMVLPEVFHDLLPGGPGEGYARLGFIFEDSPPQGRPIGTSYRERPIPMVGLNCAVCHSGTVRTSPEEPARIIMGMPANQLYAQRYQQFLMAAGQDERFNADTLIPAIQKLNPDFSWLDSLLYRFIVIPQTRDALHQLAKDFAWEDSRPRWGPGRVDTFNPYKFVQFGLPDDGTVGTADFPSLWNQRMRQGMFLHWDANNNSLSERNKSAAIGAGATEDSLDLKAMKRVADWILDLKQPQFPPDEINWSKVESGRAVYQHSCAACHAVEGQWVGLPTPIDDIGTDPERLNSITQEGMDLMNTLGTGRDWRFKNFRKTNGYANMPLDGLWLRAPYLHNGSVPTLRDLLNPSEERPKVFYRGYDVYDFDNFGFVSDGPEAERLGFKYDTTERGNGNQGHEYGTKLSQQEKDDLLEFLKTQ